MTQTLTSIISTYAAQTSMGALPDEVKEQAQKVIIDEIACGYFGRRSPAGALATNYASRFAGVEEAMMLGSGTRLPAAYAALANGTAGHGEEVDGAHVVGGHPGASIVHAAVAMAERQHATGAELINAVALGYEVGTRLVAACGGKFVVRDSKKLTSDLLYAFGCTAAASRLLGLSAVRTAHAFALASFQTNGLYALYSEKRHISKSFCNGQFAFAGISAALMSSDGLEGNEDIFGGKQGLLEAWGVEGGADKLCDGLGNRHGIMQANFKFFNAGYPIHTPVEATMSLVNEHNISAGSISDIQIGMPENAMRVVDNRDMHNICIQDMVAASVASGGLQLEDQPFPSILRDPVFHETRAKIRVGVDPEIQSEFPNGRGARVKVTTASGQEVSRRIDHPKGHCLRGPVTWEDIREKWTGSIKDCNVDTALELGKALEGLEDVRLLTNAFGGIMS